jgi:hypothetical protein
MMQDEDEKIVRKHLGLLQEHFDTVQIFVTRHITNQSGTVNAVFGSGNFFARYGQIRIWLDQTMDGQGQREEDE